MVSFKALPAATRNAMLIVSGRGRWCKWIHRQLVSLLVLPSLMPTIYTVGHSTRSLDELVAMLRAHGVAAIADVRRFAGSRRLPQFNAENLAVELPRKELAYLPCPLLGGRRKPGESLQ